MVAVGYPEMDQNHSHSIVLSNGNALIYSWKFFPRSPKNRLATRQKIALLISKVNFHNRRSAHFGDYRHQSIVF
jgi:hypothetical protein